MKIICRNGLERTLSGCAAFKKCREEERHNENRCTMHTEKNAKGFTPGNQMGKRSWCAGTARDRLGKPFIWEGATLANLSREMSQGACRALRISFLKTEPFQFRLILIVVQELEHGTRSATSFRPCNHPESPPLEDPTLCHWCAGLLIEVLPRCAHRRVNNTHIP